MIKLVNIQKNYSEKQVLKDISFEVKKGSIYALLGIQWGRENNDFKNYLGPA